MGLAVQLRVSSIDLALRGMWTRHDVDDAMAPAAPTVSWTVMLQPTIFF